MQNDVELETILRQAYNKVVNENKSFRQVAEDVGIERKKLKSLMLKYLSTEEVENLNTALDKKNNAKIVGKRHKKARKLETVEYKEEIDKLAEKGILPNWIEQIYIRCQERNQTKISRDTLAYKLVELLDYFEERNKGLSEDSRGYISSEDVINMILRNPRMITSDVKNNIVPKCTLITDKNEGNYVVANMKIKSNPGVFRKSIKNIREGR